MLTGTKKLTAFKVEVVGRLGGPEPHGVDAVVPVAGDGAVVGQGEDGVVVDPLAVPHLAAHLDRHGVLGPSLLPRIAETEPVVRFLDLHKF